MTYKKLLNIANFSDKKYYTIVFILIVVLSLFFTMPKDIVSMGVTCLSIIFAFGTSFVIGAYSKDKFNNYLKEKDQLVKFLDDNKQYLKTVLFSIVILLMLSFLQFNKEYSILSICKVFISTNHIALLVILYTLRKSLIFLDKYFILYKNTFSDRVNHYNKKNSEN